MIGIDVSKDTLSFAVVDPSTRNVILTGSVSNDEAGFKQLDSMVPSDYPMVPEPTGRYGEKLVAYCHASNRRVYMAQPKLAQQFLRSMNNRAKTDKLDCVGLALFGLAAKLPLYVLRESDVEQLSQLLKCRNALSRELATSKLQLASLPYAGEHIASHMKYLRSSIEEITAEISSLTRNNPKFKVVEQLQTVPGVGPVTATTLAVCFATHTFDEPAQFVAYCGLDIGVRQSGKRSSTTGLSKHGDAELRRLLYLSATSNISCKTSPFKDQYSRELAKGLSKVAALCSVARKLAKVCWAINKSGTEFNSSLVGRQSPPQTPPVIDVPDSPADPEITAVGEGHALQEASPTTVSSTETSRLQKDTKPPQSNSVLSPAQASCQNGEVEVRGGNRNRPRKSLRSTADGDKFA